MRLAILGCVFLFYIKNVYLAPVKKQSDIPVYLFKTKTNRDAERDMKMENSEEGKNEEKRNTVLENGSGEITGFLPLSFSSSVRKDHLPFGLVREADKENEHNEIPFNFKRKGNIPFNFRKTEIIPFHFKKNGIPFHFREILKKEGEEENDLEVIPFHFRNVDEVIPFHFRNVDEVIPFHFRNVDEEIPFHFRKVASENTIPFHFKKTDALNIPFHFKKRSPHFPFAAPEAVNRLNLPPYFSIRDAATKNTIPLSRRYGKRFINYPITGEVETPHEQVGEYLPTNHVLHVRRGRLPMPYSSYSTPNTRENSAVSDYLRDDPQSRHANKKFVENKYKPYSRRYGK